MADLLSADNCTMKVLEDTLISPLQSSVLKPSNLPLTFFDILWLGFRPMQRLLFYDFPYPSSHFIQSVLPNLKSSLSIALQSFFPLAGNLVLPPPPQMPYIESKDGDSVRFIAKESSSGRADFEYLIGDHGRRVEEFQALLPKLQNKSLIAFQVTVFPKSGIALGITFNHVLADGKAFIHFIKSWAALHGSDQGGLSSLSKPDYNRDLIKDPEGVITSKFLKDECNLEDLDTRYSGSTTHSPSNKLQVTFVIKRSQVELLKNRVRTKSMEEENVSDKLRISTFVVTYSYMWVCLNKLAEKNGTEDQNCHLIFTADCRRQLGLPATYFGNCIEPRLVAVRKSELMSENGVVVAAKAIGKEIMDFEEFGALREAENWLSKVEEVFKSGNTVVTVASSPKLAVYEIDFGWGRPRKTELAHIGSFGSISMSESREEEGGVEFGMILSQDELHSFNDVFQRGLQQLQ